VRRRHASVIAGACLILAGCTTLPPGTPAVQTVPPAYFSAPTGGLPAAGLVAAAADRSSAEAAGGRCAGERARSGGCAGPGGAGAGGIAGHGGGACAGARRIVQRDLQPDGDRAVRVRQRAERRRQPGPPRIDRERVLYRLGVDAATISTCSAGCAPTNAPPGRGSMRPGSRRHRYGSPWLRMSPRNFVAARARRRGSGSRTRMSARRGIRCR
jgi:hypothetical protein